MKMLNFPLDPLMQRQQWLKLKESISLSQPGVWQKADSPSHLSEVCGFGSNPGCLRMFTHSPPNLQAQSPLVVVLHGCLQNAAGYDQGAGWSTLADRYGFALLFPEQQHSNNPNGCFNWFQPGDTERGRGEALSIREMVDRMVSDHDIDRRRVFITGLSAGGAMASVMLATYPDVFAGGAIVAGLPYGAAANVQQAFESMRQCPSRPAPAWGNLIRSASAHPGPWPRVSVWHGGADVTVAPSNSDEIVKQWANVHGLDLAPSSTEDADGFARRVWRNADAEEVIEAFTIPHMAHGTPIETGEALDQCGRAGAFLLDVGISSSFRIAKFWGIADHVFERTLEETASERVARNLQVIDCTIRETDSSFERTTVPPANFDVGVVIANALKAAGLMDS